MKKLEIFIAIYGKETKIETVIKDIPNLTKRFPGLAETLGGTK